MSAVPAKSSSAGAPSIAQAFAHFQNGKLEQAEAICNAILGAKPEDFDSLHLLGLVRHRQGRNAEALRLVAQILPRAPHSSEVLNNYGLILAALERHEEALACFENALAKCADYPLALKNRAAALKSLARFDEALSAYEACLAARPDDLEALNECGGLHVRLGHPEAALDCYDRALALAPRAVELHVNKGTALAADGRFAQALDSFVAASGIDPQCADAHHRASLIHLRFGDFRNGWRDYEWRFRTRQPPRVRQVAAPVWRGEQPLDGKTILLLAEQGYGDTLQFIRYAPFLATQGATVFVDAPSPLREIVSSVTGVAAVLGEGEPTPAVDYHCPLLSLPLAFRTELSSIPAHVPYIRPDAARLAKWHDRLQRNGRLRVGLCWAGSPAHLNDRNRSVPLERFADILMLPDVDFVSVQKDVTDPQAALLRAHRVVELGRDFENFADTAAALAELDLVVSVDTSVAHLAGAMGKAVALLLPHPAEWRWLVDRVESPWYPTMRLFRQTTGGDWAAPLTRLRDELAAAARSRRQV
jgi:tetratricopeptide (TPR) repeat protein